MSVLITAATLPRDCIMTISEFLGTWYAVALMARVCIMWQLAIRHSRKRYLIFVRTVQQHRSVSRYLDAVFLGMQPDIFDYKLPDIVSLDRSNCIIAGSGPMTEVHLLLRKPNERLYSKAACDALSNVSFFYNLSNSCGCCLIGSENSDLFYNPCTPQEHLISHLVTRYAYRAYSYVDYTCNHTLSLSLMRFQYVIYFRDDDPCPISGKDRRWFHCPFGTDMRESCNLSPQNLKICYEVGEMPACMCLICKQPKGFQPSPGFSD